MKNKGFTLVELLVVISIISLLSVVVFANYRVGEKQFALQRLAHKLAQDIRRAQAMTMGAVECPSGTNCAGQIPPGYGIYLKQGDTFYKLYADTNPSDGNEQYNAGDVVIEEIYFEKGVYIHSANPASFSINFKPPDPTIKIRGGGQDKIESTITIALQSDTSKTKTIKVNKVGLIEVE